MWQEGVGIYFPELLFSPWLASGDICDYTRRYYRDFSAVTVLQARGTLGSLNTQQIANSCALWIFKNYFHKWQGRQCFTTSLPLPIYFPGLSVNSCRALQWGNNFGTFRLEAWSPSPPAMRAKAWWCLMCVWMKAFHTWVLSLKCAGTHSNLSIFLAFPHSSSFRHRWSSAELVPIIAESWLK